MQHIIRRKNRFVVDGKNRLIIRGSGKNLVANGRFAVDKNNRLAYWLNEPASWRRQYGLRDKIIFKGNWKINPNYDLEVNLDRDESQYKGAPLTLKGEIISTDRDTLGFQINSQDKYGLSHLQLLKLYGSWLADEYGRIYFEAKKKIGPPDILTLKGNWQVNNNQQIIYKYEKTGLKTKTKSLRALTFEGFWRIDNSSILTYILSHSSLSRFDFRAQIETPNLYPQEGVIKYRLGMGIKEQRPSLGKIICLYGSWKFSRKGGLIFLMDYGREGLGTIEFGSDIHLNKKDEIVFSLTGKKKEPLGINISFTHKFLKKYDAQAFFGLKDFLEKKETSIEAGVRIPF